jgi:hypothetical protein
MDCGESHGKQAANFRARRVAGRDFGKAAYRIADPPLKVTVAPLGFNLTGDSLPRLVASQERISTE